MISIAISGGSGACHYEPASERFRCCYRREKLNWNPLNQLFLKIMAWSTVFKYHTTTDYGLQVQIGDLISQTVKSFHRSRARSSYDGVSSATVLID